MGFLGGLTLSENKTFMGWFNNNIYKEGVISLEPEIGIGVNLLPWWSIHVDAGCWFLVADADSYTFSLTFAFGKFNQ